MERIPEPGRQFHAGQIGMPFLAGRVIRRSARQSETSRWADAREISAPWQFHPAYDRR